MPDVAVSVWPGRAGRFVPMPLVQEGEASVKPRQIVVLGMHRSGTSMIAGMLLRMGVMMGDDLIAADWSNPAGHYEDRAASQINRGILEMAGGSWRDVPSQNDIDLVYLRDCEMAWFAEMRNKWDNLWGFKDPRTLLTLAHWDKYLSNPLYVLVSRDRRAIAKSLYRRNGIEEAEAFALIERYVSRFDLVRHDRETITFEYEGVLRYPGRESKRLSDRLGVPYCKAATEFIDASLNHEGE